MSNSLKSASRWTSAIFLGTITLVVFAGFAVVCLGERMRWNHFAAFLCIIAAVAFTFLPKN